MKSCRFSLLLGNLRVYHLYVAFFNQSFASYCLSRTLYYTAYFSCDQLFLFSCLVHMMHNLKLVFTTMLPKLVASTFWWFGIFHMQWWQWRLRRWRVEWLKFCFAGPLYFIILFIQGLQDLYKDGYGSQILQYVDIPRMWTESTREVLPVFSPNQGQFALRLWQSIKYSNNKWRARDTRLLYLLE